RPVNASPTANSSCASTKWSRKATRFMSSPKTATAKAARRPATRARAAAKPERKPVRAQTGASTRAKTTRAKPNGGDGVVGPAEATRSAAAIEQALANGQRDVLSADALQALMAAVCKAYAARVEGGEELLPLPARGGATATDVMVTASGLLKAANLAVFELGMWQSWTGRWLSTAGSPAWNS